MKVFGEIIVCVSVWAALSGNVQVVRAQCVADELVKLVNFNDNFPGNDLFGYSISISGDFVLIGAIEDSSRGSASIFRYDGSAWNHQVRLFRLDGIADRFGQGISLDDDVALIGAPADDDLGASSGSAFVYRFTGFFWRFEEQLNASNGAAFDSFGFDLEIDGDKAVIAASRSDIAGLDAGAAYVFCYSPDKQQWTEETILTASDAAPEDRFGFDVAMSGDVVVVGAHHDDDTGADSGSAYVFRFNPGTEAWEEEQKLVASTVGPGDEFGNRVATNGEVAVIGARFDDDLGVDAGSAYIYRYDAASQLWVEEAKVTAADGMAGDRFGVSVSISENELVLIGADQSKNEGPFRPGAAHLFQRIDGVWTEVAKLISSDGNPRDYFGWDADITNEWIGCGAFRHDAGGTNSGAAYMFKGLTDCNMNTTLDICDAANEDCNNNDTPDECEPGGTDDSDGDGVVDLCDICQGFDDNLDDDGNGIADCCDFVNPLGLAVQTDGVVVVTNTGPPSKIIRVNPLDCERDVVPGSFVPSFSGVAVEADGNLVVTASMQGAVLRVDPVTGNQTVVSDSVTGNGPFFLFPGRIAVEADGNLVVTDATLKAVLRVNPVTGDRTIVSDPANGSGLAFENPFGIAVEADGNLVVADSSLGTVFRVNPFTGDRTIVSNANFGNGPIFRPTAITVEDEDHLVVTDDLLDAVFRVDVATGDRSIVSDSANGNGPSFIFPADIAVTLDGSFVVTNQGAPVAVLVRVDPVTGDRETFCLSFIGDGDMDCNGDTNPLDIAPFVMALVDPDNYALAYPFCDVANGDLTGDGFTNGDDIEAFLDKLLASN
ncbi:MAG: hypothetical protein MI923_05615 [Phycisphaerales bacterium]|nr:hypothetical protein [Phycisphaerales bacterium]